MLLLIPSSRIGSKTGYIMTAEWPRITGRATTKVSPWVDLIAREVEFAPGDEIQVYHSVRTSDYVQILAITPDGKIPLVSQYRPALEAFTVELPAGLLDDGEEAAATAKRELLEETGFPAATVRFLGVHATESGRLSNRTHSFFIETAPRIPDFEPEPGINLRLVSPGELLNLVSDGALTQGQLGTLLQAVVRLNFNFENGL
jgi:ADP-ribose pyrophosphatase